MNMFGISGWRGGGLRVYIYISRYIYLFMYRYYYNVQLFFRAVSSCLVYVSNLRICVSVTVPVPVRVSLSMPASFPVSITATVPVRISGLGFAFTSLVSCSSCLAPRLADSSAVGRLVVKVVSRCGGWVIDSLSLSQCGSLAFGG